MHNNFRFFAATSVMLVVIALLQLLQTENVGRNFLQRYGEIERQDQQLSLQHALRANHDQMAAHLQSITRDRQLTDALFSGKRNRLPTLLLPTWRRLSTSKVLTHLLLTDPTGKIIFASDEGAEASTIAAVAHQAALSKQAVDRVFVDSAKNLEHTYAFPLFAKRGKVVAVAVFLHHMDTLLANFEEEIQGYTALFVPPHHITITDPDFQVFANTTHGIDEIKQGISQIGTGKKQQLNIGERVFFMHALEIPNLLSPLQVKLITLVDRTSLIQQHRNEMLLNS